MKLNIILFVGFFLKTNAQTVCLEGGSTCYKGSFRQTENGNEYASFQGIRYAQVPTGDLRFKSPISLDTTLGEIDVSQDSEIQCVQFSGEDPEGQEDCLTLNIYIPKEAFSDEGLDRKFPVMAWIYGGGYIVGTNAINTYNPDFFMDTQNVVLVAINYRLGPLGFLRLPIPNTEVKGNFKNFAAIYMDSVAYPW